MKAASLSTPIRCPWCGHDPVYVAYHDAEWAVPLRDERDLFELLNLEGAQAGLSWITVLKKRDRYRALFHGFHPERVAEYSDEQLEVILTDPGIIRNRLKVYAVRENARALLRMRSEGEDFSTFLWSFVGGCTIVNSIRTPQDFRAHSPESDAMSKALKKRGFKFVGSTICYAFMQAAGMVDDHTDDCFKKGNRYSG